MHEVGDQLRAIAPALAFLLAGVPLAALLDRLGFFGAVVDALGTRSRPLSLTQLWFVAALTTIVLNLDTTVVLLTPLYIRVARRARLDPLALAAVPLLLASLASSVLPVSNLTTLLAADQLALSTWDVLSHLALPTAVACVVAGALHRRRHPTLVRIVVDEPVDTSERTSDALRVGGVLVAALLVAFVVGPRWGVAPWMAAAVADVVLMVRLRHIPWREVPVRTAAAVAAIAAVVAVVVPADALTDALQHDRPAAVMALAAGGALTADLVNNLPAVLVAIDGTSTATWGFWGWLLGVNAGAVLVPLGALANLLWLRVARDEGIAVGLRRYLGITVPVAGPAVIAAIAVLGVERAITR